MTHSFFKKKIKYFLKKGMSHNYKKFFVPLNFICQIKEIKKKNIQRSYPLFLKNIYN